MNIHLRPPKQSDLSAILKLLIQISPFTPDEEDYTAIWNRYAKQANVISVVATNAQQEILGYGALVVECKLRGDAIGHVEDIVVSPDHHKLGIGKMIMRHLEEKATEAGCYKLSLSCYENNVAFYGKSGFDKSGIYMRKMLIS